MRIRRPLHCIFPFSEQPMFLHVVQEQINLHSGFTINYVKKIFSRAISGQLIADSSLSAVMRGRDIRISAFSCHVSL